MRVSVSLLLVNSGKEPNDYVNVGGLGVFMKSTYNGRDTGLYSLQVSMER